MGTYPPRECGIATFNQDLLNSSQKFLGDDILCKVAAMNLSPLDTYIYPPVVEWKLDQNNKKEYADLAGKFNRDPQITGVIIQHEYGIYGGVDGENILSFIENCHKPMVISLHTVLPSPTAKMKAITRRIIECANVIIVLTHRSKEILETVYPQAVDKVHVIPHGIHDTKFDTTKEAKKKLKLQNVTVLSTFGLLSRGKGIEYVLQALPKVIKKHPSIRYLILGKTHPVVRRNEGESYRNELADLVTKLDLKKHVLFFDQYLSLTDLFKFLKATDIYISTSINPDQAVSGTLSYALGTGRAVISTNFVQAQELLTQETGRLVPSRDPQAYADALIELLGNEQQLKTMHRSAYEITRPMLWSNVANQYSKLLTQNILPPLNLNYLFKMTDDFGLFQFANLDVPDLKSGYTLDDNARALVVCSQLQPKSDPKINQLITIYLNLIQECQQPDGTFINYINHEHKQATHQNKQEDLEEATARAMWALAEVMHNKLISANSRDLAKTIFIKALPHAKELQHIRSASFVIKSFALAQSQLPEYSRELLDEIIRKADFLIAKLDHNSEKSWQWFESYLGYNNAIVPEALLIASQATNNQLYLNKGLSSLNFLTQKTFTSNRYLPIGQSHWYKNNQKRSDFDQQPEDPASTILALATAYQITHDDKYKKLIRVCFSWFLGNNSLQLPLYKYDSGSCYDGLHPDRVNLNQGAESLISYLLSRLAIEQLPSYENPRN